MKNTLRIVILLLLLIADTGINSVVQAEEISSSDKPLKTIDNLLRDSQRAKKTEPAKTVDALLRESSPAQSIQKEPQPGANQANSDCLHAMSNGLGVRITADQKDSLLNVKDGLAQAIGVNSPHILYQVDHCVYAIAFDAMGDALMAAQILLRDDFQSMDLVQNEKNFSCVAGSPVTCGVRLEHVMVGQPADRAPNQGHM
ncbi:MAG: hypothetical protein ACD_73C00542G0003 [uncultured bacterium]|nr:MAG: hypothetical protein ACD_73C00542G0003 [uncultured bacterium]